MGSATRRAGRWLGLGLGALALLAGAAWLAGSLLPREHVASVRAELDASPEAVWQRLTDLEGLSTWRPDVERVEILERDGARTVWRETTGFGPMTMETVDVQPARRLEVRIVDTEQGFGGGWRYDLDPAPGGGTIVTVTERGRIDNPLFRFFSRYVTGYHATMEDVLRRLGRSFEEDVTPRRVPPPSD
jgi:hypothetical protein